MSGTVISVTVHKKNDFPQYRRLGKKKVTWGFMILFRPCLGYPEQGFFYLMCPLVDDFFGKILWRCVFALGMLCMFGACVGIKNTGSVWSREPHPDFARVCEAKGYVADNWAKAICIEEERMSWEADPEQWWKDRARVPSPPGLWILPPERVPFHDKMAPLSRTPFKDP